MKRLFVAAVVCAAVLLVTAPVALAWTAPLHPVGHNRTAAHVPYVERSADRAPLRYEPLARRILSGTGTISLNVYSYAGQPEVNARADWWVSTDSETTAPATRTPTRADTST